MIDFPEQIKCNIEAGLLQHSELRSYFRSCRLLLVTRALFFFHLHLMPYLKRRCIFNLYINSLWYPYNNDTEVEGEGCVDSKRSDQFKMMCTWRNNNIIIWFIRRFLQIKRLCECFVALSIHVVGECFIVSTSYCVISYIPSPKCWDIKRQLSRNSSPCDFDYSVSTWHWSYSLYI